MALRLANGNTLITSMSEDVGAVEFDRAVKRSGSTRPTHARYPRVAALSLVHSSEFGVQNLTPNSTRTPMRPLTRLLLVVASLLLFVPAAHAADDAAVADEQLLRSLNMPTDGAGLVEFFKKRTFARRRPTEDSSAHRQLGDDEFDVREKAMQDLGAIGAVAKTLLREANQGQGRGDRPPGGDLPGAGGQDQFERGTRAAVRQIGRKHSAWRRRGTARFPAVCRGRTAFSTNSVRSWPVWE